MITIFNLLTTRQQWMLVDLLLQYYDYLYTMDNYHEYECGEHTDNTNYRFYDIRFQLLMTNIYK
jgi:hypothetical protein